MRKNFYWSYEYGSETKISDNCIVWRPVITLYGSFHKRIGRLVLDLLASRVLDLVEDVSEHLSSDEKSEEVSGNEC